MCENFGGEICGECRCCHLTFNSSHPDLKVLDLTIGDDGKQKASISVEAIRELKKDVYLRPFFSKRKIYILENAEKMTVEAQNAMLKIFEEPPSYVTIILICNGLSKILSTIKSRAVTYKFPNLKPKELENYLNTYYNGVENKSIYANISDGSIGKMLSMILDEESLSYRSGILTAFLKIVKNAVSVSINDLFDIFMKNKDDRFNILNLISVFVFDMAYIKTKNKERVVNIDYIKEIEAVIGNISLTNVYNMEKILAEASEKISKNANYKLAVMNMLIKLREEIHG